MSQVACGNCSKMFTRVVGKYLKYCPECSEMRPTYQRICSVCKSSFETKRFGNYRCLACQAVAEKDRKNKNEIEKSKIKQKPKLMNPVSDEEQMKIDMERYKDWVKPICIESMRNQETGKFEELKKFYEGGISAMGKCTVPECEKVGVISGHCASHAKESPELSVILEKKNERKREIYAKKTLEKKVLLQENKPLNVQKNKPLNVQKNMTENVHEKCCKIVDKSGEVVEISAEEFSATLQEFTEMRTALVRTFATGATRSGGDKPEYAGYFSPWVMEAYGQYMFEHQVQPDGTIRDCRNWQRGITQESYMQSLKRHELEVWLHHEQSLGDADYIKQNSQEFVTSLMALIFNAQGMAHELIRGR